MQMLNKNAIVNTIFNTDYVNEHVDILTSTINKCLDCCVPVVTQEILVHRPHAPWMTDEIREAITARSTALDIRKESNQSNKKTTGSI